MPCVTFHYFEDGDLLLQKDNLFFSFFFIWVKIISVILSWVSRKVGQKRQITEKNHLTTHLSHVTKAGLKPTKVKWQAI